MKETFLILEMLVMKKNKKLHRSVIDNYNKKPNRCLYCNGPILAKENEKIYYVKKESFVAVVVLQNIVMHTGIKTFT